MRRFLKAGLAVLAAACVLSAATVSEARWFGRGWCGYSTYSPTYVATPAVAPASATTPAPTAPGPTPRTTYMPIAQPEPAQPAAPAYDDGRARENQAWGGGNMPQSSWDFGRWPPY